MPDSTSTVLCPVLHAGDTQGQVHVAVGSSAMSPSMGLFWVFLFRWVDRQALNRNQPGHGYDTRQGVH